MNHGDTTSALGHRLVTRHQWEQAVVDRDCTLSRSERLVLLVLSTLSTWSHPAAQPWVRGARVRASQRHIADSVAMERKAVSRIMTRVRQAGTRYPERQPPRYAAYALVLPDRVAARLGVGVQHE